MRICDIGEKKLIADIIRPMFNPHGDPDSVGDDCAIITIGENAAICVSTDRVPADLIAYKLGLIDLRQLGYYLAVLNLSDLAAAGGLPRGLLLNLGFPKDFPVQSLKEILDGVAQASTEYHCPVIGGDLSDSGEMNLVATAVGVLNDQKRLYRTGAQPGDVVFCCDVVGITPTAFAYFLSERKSKLNTPEEDVLCSNFRRPKARIALGSLLRESGACSSVMDNTDGIGQSLSELAQASKVAIEVDENLLPICDMSRDFAKRDQIDVTDLVMGPGADFQLIGAMRQSHLGYERIKSHVHVIGIVRKGEGVWMRRENGVVQPVRARGWNYYTPHVSLL